MKKIILSQFIVLLAGTLFAWFNFLNEYIYWAKNSFCTVGCTGGTNPFFSPCFGGAVFFTIALVLHSIIMKKGK